MDFTQTQSQTIVGGQTGFAVPLIVSVTGHRDLVAEEIPAIRERVSTFLTDLCSEYPDRGVSVMSALAEGADQLVAEEAVRLGIPLIVPLPMARCHWGSICGWKPAFKHLSSAWGHAWASAAVF